MSMIPRMAHLLKGSAAIIPSLTLNFLSGVLDPRITFSRASQATLTDSTGKITYAPNNLLTNSESFEAAAWTKSAATITANATIAPDGTTTADKLVEDTATSTHNVRSGSISIVSGANYNASVYVSAAGRTRVQLVSFNGVSDVITTFDLTAGSVVSGSGSIASVGGGWFRISQFFTAAATVSTPYAFQIFLVSTGTTTSYTGNGASGVNIWGAQLEQVTYQTSPRTYIPTTTAAYYGPRFDYDPVTLAPRGLLIEEQRTNLLTYSEQFDNAAWSKTNSTVTANATTAPSGTVTADLLVANTSNLQHRLDYSTTIAAGTYSFSTYAKAGGYNFIFIRIGLNGGYANLSNGSVANVSAGYTLTATDVGSGWYRVTLTGAAALNDIIRINVCQSLTSDFAGDGTSGIYLWGAQLEAGSFATSYIPTVASQVTRSADIATMTGANFSNWYNQNEGTFSVGADTADASTANRSIYYVSNSGSTEIIYGVAGTLRTLRVISNSVETASVNAGVFSNNTPAKTSGAYKINDFAASFNGGAVSTDTSGAVATGVDRMTIGANTTLTASSYLNGHIRSISYYNTRLDNDRLQGL